MKTKEAELADIKDLAFLEVKNGKNVQDPFKEWKKDFVAKIYSSKD
jgi:hypothetical protein